MSMKIHDQARDGTALSRYASKYSAQVESPGDLSILIVDDHELVRAGMRRLLEDAGNIGNFHEVASGEEAIGAVKKHRFDIVFMDLSLPGMSGVEATFALLRRRPESKIIVMTAAMRTTFVKQLLDSGVKGYLTKDCSPQQMEQAVAEVMAGNVYLSPQVASQLALNPHGDGVSGFAGLSKREAEVVLFTLHGHANRQISERLYISEKTVSTHRRRAFEKLDVTNTVEMAHLAIVEGIWDDLMSAQSFADFENLVSTA